MYSLFAVLGVSVAMILALLLYRLGAWRSFLQWCYRHSKWYIRDKVLEELLK